MRCSPLLPFLLALCASVLVGAGCTDPAPASLLGTWEEVGGQRGTLTFSESGRFLLDLQRPDEPVEEGTYRVEGDRIVVQVGAVTTQLTLHGDRLAQEDGTVYRRRDL